MRPALGTFLNRHDDHSNQADQDARKGEPGQRIAQQHETECGGLHRLGLGEGGAHGKGAAPERPQQGSRAANLSDAANGAVEPECRASIRDRPVGKQERSAQPSERHSVEETDVGGTENGQRSRLGGGELALQQRADVLH